MNTLKVEIIQDHAKELTTKIETLEKT